MNNTNIGWTDRTWNPFRGCTRVSEGCRYCYAEVMSARFSGVGEPYEGLAKYVNVNGIKEARWTNEIMVVDHVLDAPLRWQKPSMVFVNSMSDLFHEKISDDDILYVFDVMNKAEKHTFQILTKRPKRLLELDNKINWTYNIWMGVSVENKETLHRMSELGKCNAHIKFVSAEPLIDDICPELDSVIDNCDWIIVGGESGSKAREMKPEWAIKIYECCKKNDVSYFFKQVGGRDKKKGGDKLYMSDGTLLPQEYPINTGDYGDGHLQESLF